MWVCSLNLTVLHSFPDSYNRRSTRRWDGSCTAIPGGSATAAPTRESSSTGIDSFRVFKIQMALAMAAAIVIALWLLHAPILQGLAGLLVVDQPAGDYDCVCLRAWGFGPEGDRSFDAAGYLCGGNRPATSCSSRRKRTASRKSTSCPRSSRSAVGSWKNDACRNK